MKNKRKGTGGDFRDNWGRALYPEVKRNQGSTDPRWRTCVGA